MPTLNRTVALTIAAAGTFLLLEGLALGLHLGFGFATTGAWPEVGIDCDDLVESAVWVALMVPAVVYLRTRRARVWPTSLLLAFGVAVVTFARMSRSGEAAGDALLGAWLDGVGFALGLLCFDYLHGSLVRSQTTLASALRR